MWGGEGGANISLHPSFCILFTNTTYIFIYIYTDTDTHTERETERGRERDIEEKKKNREKNGSLSEGRKEGRCQVVLKTFEIFGEGKKTKPQLHYTATATATATALYLLTYLIYRT